MRTTKRLVSLWPASRATGAGTVAVRATSALRDGVPRLGRFRAVVKRPATRFGLLPRLRMRPSGVSR